MNDLFDLHGKTAWAGYCRACVMLIIAAASAFGWLMAVAEVPLRMSEALLSISENPLVLLLVTAVPSISLGLPGLFE